MIMVLLPQGGSITVISVFSVIRWVLIRGWNCSPLETLSS